MVCLFLFKRKMMSGIECIEIYENIDLKMLKYDYILIYMRIYYNELVNIC